MPQETKATKRDTTGLYRALAIGLLAGAYVWFKSDGDTGRMFTAILGTMILIVGLEYGWWVRLGDKWPALYGRLQSLWYFILGWIPAQSASLKPYDIIFGWDAKNPRKPIYANLKKMKSFAVFGVNGSGKTSLIHSIIHDIIASLTADEIKLVIFDPKSKKSERGLDFSIYRWLPHLLWPIATTEQEIGRALKLLENLMNERSKLFELLPERRLVNDMDRYNYINEQMGLGLPELVPVLIVLEEVQVLIKYHKDAERIITDVGREGRSYGLFIAPCTQLPKVSAIPTEIKEQCYGRFVGALSSNRAYGNIADVTEDVYGAYKLGEHQFFVRLYAGSEWQVMTANLVPYDELESLALELSGKQLPRWPGLSDSTTALQTAVPQPAPVLKTITPLTGVPEFQTRDNKIVWPRHGTEEQKVVILKTYLMRFSEKPTISETMADLDWSQRTAETWVPKVWTMLHP